jgi:lycopene cyclase domain-containing protein
MKSARTALDQHFPLAYSFLLLAGLALAYTTPWDNYLVATKVWWYDPALVLGVTIGWVPLEEYLFFILQPVLGGLVLLLLLSRKTAGFEGEPLKPEVRKPALPTSFAVWAIGMAVLILGIPSMTYLGLELAWALPVIMLQLAFGADILWKHRRQLLAVIGGLTIYLSLADGYAIQSGVWTIDPQQSTGMLLAGVLPVEELVFFLLTNIMVGFGFVLIWSPESQTRLADAWQKVKSWQGKSNLHSEQ